MLKKIPLLLDKPLNSSDADQFGHEHYAEALFDLITNQNLRMPYNIGLLGQWGVGKSSIKELCKNKLKSMDNIHCIDFNAWKYSGDSIKRALLRDIYLEIGGSDEKIKDEFSRQITRQVQELCNNRELCDNLKNFIWNWSQIILFNLLLFFAYYKILPNLEIWGDIVSTVSFATVSAIITKSLLDKNNMLIPIFQNITKVDIPSATTEVYESFLKKQIEEYKKEHSNINKIVVFIDDLDRLPTAEEMVDGINAIRTFMDIKINEEIGFIFVVSCCEYKISDALMTINNLESNKDCSKQTEAKRFLDKIFHFRLDIPPFPYRDMIEYSKKIIESQIADFNEFEYSLIQSGTNLENLLCRLMHPDVQSPRQAIQILNTFFQSWNIALRRESSEMTNKVGGLAPKIVTGHPLVLAILSVLKVDFPYFYKELLNEPKLLEYVLEVLRTKQEPQFYVDLRIKEQFVEKRIIEKDSKNIEEFIIRPEFYDLKKYLNLIKNKFELPVSLKPFLLLNQNKLSREYGEDAFELENALIQNDYEKLMSILNIEEDKLSVETATLLKSAYESIPYEMYKKNAFKLLNKLVPYIGENTRFLIDSFPNILSEDATYRNLIKMDNFKSLLYKVHVSDTTKIIFALKQKYMQKFYYSQESKDDNNKLIQFKNAANIILEYCNKNNYLDVDIINWLLNPIYANTAEAPHEPLNFGFSFIFSAFQNYEFIYQYKSKEYIDTIIKEFQKDKSFITEENETKVIQTFEKALDYILINQNEKFNDVFDNIIEEENTKLYSYIIDYTKKNISNFTDSNINNYVIQLDIAIENKLNNDIKTEFDIKEQLENFRDLLNVYYQKIEIDNYQYIDELCEAIVPNKNYTAQIIEIINILRNNNYDNISKIDTLIVNQLFQFEPESENLKLFLNYLFNNYNNLSNKNKISFANNYADFVMDTNVSSLEESTLNEFKQYIDMILAEKNEQVASIYLDKFFEFTSDYLITNEEKEYFEQLLCLLPILSLGNTDKVKDFIILILENVDFSYDYSDKIGQLALACGENIWNNDNRIDESFNQITTDDVNDKKLDCAINLYNTIARIQTPENLINLYKLILKLENIELKEKRRWLEQLPKEKIYTTDEFIELITSNDSEVRDYESIRNLNERLLDVYTLEERKYILSKLLFNDSFAELFKVVIDVNYKITGKYSELNEIIDENSRNNNINQLLTKRTLITDMLLGENRKEPSKILLLNTKIIEESNIENKQEIITQMLQWSYDLYNDIMRDIEIRGFSDSLKEIINKIFAGKTFGKIRFRNKQ